MPSLAEFTDANFDAEVIRSDKPVLVDFWAESCSPCKRMHPVIKKLAQVLDGRVKVGRLNVVENPEVTQALSIKGIPYLIVVRAGAIVLEMIGDRALEELRQKVELVV